jgi:hypothetical protein
MDNIHKMIQHTMTGDGSMTDLCGEHSGVELVCLSEGLFVEALVDEVDHAEHTTAVCFL